MLHLSKARYRYGGSNEVEHDEGADSAPGFFIDRLDIAPEGMTAIVGPSGSGKTTLLSILAGFLYPTLEPDGSFTFSGVPVSPKGHPAGRVAFVFQSAMLLGAASGFVNAMQGYAARTNPAPLGLGTIRELANRLSLRSADGKTLLAKRARLLSGGEAQRMAILRALLSDPQMILCDEPTSSLDESNAAVVLDALREWSTTKNRPVVWVTHNLTQASEYANSFLFVSKGRIFRPTKEQQDRLSSKAQRTRLAALREISAELSGEVEAPDATHRTPEDVQAVTREASNRDEPTVAVSEGQYAGWIANALSTDGLAVDGFEAARPLDLSPSGAAASLALLDGKLAGRQSFWRRAKLWLQNYSRYSLALLLCFMLLQIQLAVLIGNVAERYATERLEDPAVARLVFELVVEADDDRAELEERLLFPSRIRSLDAAISAAIGLEEAAPDVQVYGRRSMPDSRLRFQTPNEACNSWVTVETAALARQDPLLRQTQLDDTVAGLDATIDPVLEAAERRASDLVMGNDSDGHAVAMLDRRFVDRLLERCDIDPANAPIFALWDTGLNVETPLRVFASMTDAPPLYPVSPELLVFEDEYQAALQRVDSRAPDAPRIATAYFPIQAFDIAERVLSAEGYRIRDDSSAAVQTLQQVETVARSVPDVIRLFALAVAAVVVVIGVNSILEINKRVLALFMAHGMKLRTILQAFFLHLLPTLFIAAIGAPLLIAILGFVALRQFGPRFFGLIEPANAIQSWTVSFGWMLVVVGLSLVFVVGQWWRQTRRRLKTYLQE